VTSETRELAAILATDVVGFSRRTGADEERMLARLRALGAAFYKLVCFDTPYREKMVGACAKPGCRNRSALARPRVEAIMISTNS
jgi:hypothetical protein